MQACRGVVPSALGIAALAACSGGGGVAPTSTIALAVIAASPTTPAVWLDEPLRIVCNQPLDLDSVSPATLQITALDPHGAATGEPVAGVFSVDDEARELRFTPALPTAAAYVGAGWRPGRSYHVRVAGGPSAPTALRSRDGAALAAPFEFSFTTRDGSSPAELYRDARPGGPRLRLPFRF